MEHYPLMGPWGGEELPLFGKPVPMSLDKYPTFLSFLMCPSMTEETIHLPPAPDMTGEGRGGSADLGAGARLRKNGWAEEEEGVGDKVDPYPLI